MSDHNEDAELEQDVLKLQIHSIPLNLNWNADEEEYDDESEEGAVSNYSYQLYGYCFA